MAALLLIPITVGAVITLLANVAGSVGGAVYEPIVNIAGIGAVLGWFMFRNEPRMRAIEAAIDRSSRVQLAMLLLLPNLNDSSRKAAQEMVDEIERKK